MKPDVRWKAQLSRENSYLGPISREAPSNPKCWRYLYLAHKMEGRIQAIISLSLHIIKSKYMTTKKLLLSAGLVWVALLLITLYGCSDAKAIPHDPCQVMVHDTFYASAVYHAPAIIKSGYTLRAKCLESKTPIVILLQVNYIEYLYLHIGDKVWVNLTTHNIDDTIEDAMACQIIE